jgi:sulfite exporter TauE/SafE
MDTALVTAALLMGTAGGPHCAAMCGAAASVVAAPGGPSRPLLALHLGRVAGYAVAGALVAASVASLGTLQTAAPLLRPIWALVHVAALALGLYLAWSARMPEWFARPRLAALAEARPIRVFRAMPYTARAGIAGACWVAIPCGLLQSALLVAALASGPAAGAVVMTAFAGTSAFGLWLAPQLWLRLRRGGHGERLASWSVRLSGVLLAGSSAFALWHGLGAAIGQALCASPA